MGLFSKIKEMIKRSRTQKLNSGEDDKRYGEQSKSGISLPYTITLTEDDQTLVIESIEVENEFVHSNGEKTTLMVAKAYHLERSDDAIIFGGPQERRISFEISKGTQIDETIINKIAGYYMFERDQAGYSDEFTYIGKISDDKDDMKINKSQGVMGYIQNRVMPRIEQEKQEELRRIEESNRAREENERKNNETFRARIKEEQEKYEATQNEIKQRRLQNPYLKDVTIGEMNGKRDYDGINMGTGEILRVRHADKVGKDENGTYLYTAWIYSTPNEHDVEFFSLEDVPNGQAVCFTLDKKIENIIEKNDPQEIISLLYLLTTPQIAKPQDLSKDMAAGIIDYIGDLKDGRISEQRFDDLSGPIKDTIVGLKEKFINSKSKDYHKEQ